jgi:hypothetical protein
MVTVLVLALYLKEALLTRVDKKVLENSLSRDEGTIVCLPPKYRQIFVES